LAKRGARVRAGIAAIQRRTKGSKIDGRTHHDDLTGDDVRITEQTIYCWLKRPQKETECRRYAVFDLPVSNAFLQVTYP